MADAGGPLPLERLEQGDPGFVDALRLCRDADALAAFAPVWFQDRRAESRRLLFEYLDRPLNAYRHEGLVKRLFKLAEAAGDDELMARFLVLFDRSVRRVRRVRKRSVREEHRSKDEATKTADLWRSLGYRGVRQWGMIGRYTVVGSVREESIRRPSQDAMPRGLMVETIRWSGTTTRQVAVPDWSVALGLDGEEAVSQPGYEDRPEVRAKLERFRLFRLETREYLRRRAWRYFRKLGQADPERYVVAVSRALTLYRDADAADGLALIDNWGLVQILFHHTPVLEAKTSGWRVRPGRSLAELAPAPAFEAAWDQAPSATVGLLTTARATAVRRWAIRRVEADPTTHRLALDLEGWLRLVEQGDPEIAPLAAGMIEGMKGLEDVPADRWLAILESADPDAIEGLCRLVDRHVRADQVPLERAVGLAGSRALPLARLGLAWLEAKAHEIQTGDQVGRLLPLLDAASEPTRPRILGWLRATLAALDGFDPAWVVGFLDSSHADARAEGWAWYRSEPRASGDPATWRKLLESPYDDVRLALVADLEGRAARGFEVGDPGPLWASVLLNIHRGSRARPAVVRQLVGRIEAQPAEATSLLPLLGVALRSIRGPERRAALVALVRLVESRPGLEPLVRSSFPELRWEERVAP